MNRQYRQINVAFPSWVNAETVAVAHIAPQFEEARVRGWIALWWFIRKSPCWRIRYLLSDGGPEAETSAPPSDEAGQHRAHPLRHTRDL
ncbi:hypothetical protein GCM10009850_079570 [Nonomuraea monospora]|uniref:Uncharacterized protein n=1 Tax=Nonomuraea monospora TaxID=568818 RepID=A0ABP5PNX5_9ACTN